MQRERVVQEIILRKGAVAEIKLVFHHRIVQDSRRSPAPESVASYSISGLALPHSGSALVTGLFSLETALIVR